MNNQTGNRLLYQRLWRWHFFAGWLVCPFAILLAISGAIYLFKPQIEAYQAARINALASTSLTGGYPAEPLTRGLEQLLERYPDARLKKLVLNRSADDPTVEFELKQGDGRLFSYWLELASGQVLAVQERRWQLLYLVKKFHSELLLGNWGSYFVELMACWLIILILSGLYLWLSKPQPTPASSNPLARRLLVQPHSPAKRSKRAASRQRWRSWHGVLGLWSTLPILILLFSGLPWTQLWGSAFDQLKRLGGWQGPGQEWRVTLQSNPAMAPSALWEIRSDQEEDEGLLREAPTPAGASGANKASGADKTPDTDKTLAGLPIKPAINLDLIADKPEVRALSAPVYIMPPKPNNGVWTVRAMPPQRWQRVTLHYDQYSGQQIMRIGFEDHPGLERFVSLAISLHEGALFGWLNQLLGLLAALAVVLVSLLGLYLSWRKKKQTAQTQNTLPLGLSAPARVQPPPSPGLLLLLACLGLLLPMAGLSMLGIILLEYGLKLFRDRRPAWLNK